MHKNDDEHHSWKERRLQDERRKIERNVGIDRRKKINDCVMLWQDYFLKGVNPETSTQPQYIPTHQYSQDKEI